MEDFSSTINIENAEIQGDSKPKTRRKTFDVWNNFTNEEPDKDGKNVKCNHCLKRWKYEGPQSSGSSNHEVGEPKFIGGGGVRKMKMNPNVLAGYKRHKGLTSDAKSALDVYLEDIPIDENAEIDLLKYWKDHSSSNFGVLARMACDVFSIPITTVLSESSFSIGAHVLNKYRNRLLPEKVQALICTRNWLHGYSNDSEDDEEEAKDQAKASKIIDLEECH
ncbi:uncharacterized protein LOC121774319 [Salvia splendens]|uniref:uncharacterized protein LOC121774319 n=1 Tax=Salvia splendens TaxID=180675 RepID=UPI001C254852|nr:uncharacterized protein LOC121774319 [Salvia splendens]